MPSRTRSPSGKEQNRGPGRRCGQASPRRSAAACPSTPHDPDFRSQLAAIVEHSNDAIFSRTLGGRITTWNRAAERIFGYAREEILGRNSRILLAPGTQETFGRVVRRVRQGKVVEHFETTRRHRDGRLLQVSLTLSPIRDQAHRVVGFSTIARDITGRKRLADMLARRESELADLFENASVGLVTATPPGEVLRANAAFLAAVGANLEAVAKHRLAQWFTDANGIAELFERLRRRETIQNHAAELRALRGGTKHVLIDADGRWESGHLAYSRWFVRDISRRRQLEREVLSLSDREQRGFAQELHDGLGQQLGGIAYLANVLHSGLVERQAPEAAAAERIVQLMRRAIEDTRRMARGMSPIGDDPGGLLVALKDLAGQTADLRGVRCRCHCHRPVLVGDVSAAGHLFRIAQEAVNNAIRHGKARQIDITLAIRRRNLELTVSDNGVGIGPLAPRRSGLGLRIMEYRASLIRARLTVTRRPRGGTCVRCTLPQAKTETAS